ncbi:hypothetical protein LUZ60_004042 [Juncus effusus]|nr:hypothetical protein LUZ60_004042 [Juncus effusus]
MVRGVRGDAEAELNLPPGFRFHPTDEELVVHYLCQKVSGKGLPVPIIAEVDLYKFNPWDLPERALFGQKEWYFFTPRDRKYPNGSRPNRAAGRGYWKATGADKPIKPSGLPKPLGIKKALVFYHGKAPKGVKTDWIMHEYRLADVSRTSSKKGTLRLDDWVLCRLYNKKNNWEKINDQNTPSNDVAMTPESDIDHEHESGLLDQSDFAQNSSNFAQDSSNFAQNSSNFVQSSSNFAQKSSNYVQKSSNYVQNSSNNVQNNGSNFVQNSSNMTVQKKEENNDWWFTDLNLDEFQGPLMNFGTTGQDFFF